jgi:hypothetical protein
MSLRKAAEMALEALEQTPTANKLFDESSYEAQKDAIEALRQALAEPEQEPVAWMYVNKDGECEQIDFGYPFWDPDVTPLYTAPPKREWAGLTEEEFSELLYFDGRLDNVEVPLIADLIRAVQAKLKEKNSG